MPTAKRPCPTPGCGRLIARGDRACTEHARQREQARGTRQERGYGPEHDAARARWAPEVAAGRVTCWRCGQPIAPGTAWHLGHDDHDRAITRGPEHAASCNLRAAGLAVHGLPWTPTDRAPQGGTPRPTPP